MEKQKQKAIEHHNVALMVSMDSLAVIDNLRAGLLTLLEKKSIKESHPTRRDRNRELTSILFRKREDLKPFEGFLEALKKTDASHAIMAEAILKTYKHGIGATALEKVSCTPLSPTEETKYDLQIAQQTLKDVYLTRFKQAYPFSLSFTFNTENTWVPLTLKDDVKNSQATEDHAKLLKKAFDKVKMLIIEGNPATGKTSLMRRLAYEWASGKQELLHYDLVLYAEFRKVREKTFKSIADLVLYYSKTLLKKESYEKLEKLMNNEQFCKEYRVLILLDGYDESSLEKQCSEFSSFMKEKAVNKQLFFDTVITTRKGHLSNLGGREGRFVFAEVLGFTTKQQKDNYIYSHFLSKEIDNKDNIAAVHHFLDNNRNLNKLAETPLFLTFICLVHERIIVGTLVELYCSIIWWLIDRHQKDFPDRDIPYSFGFQNSSDDKFEIIQNHYLHFPQLHRLGKMAVRNLQENVFGYSDCEQFHLQPIIEQVGLLRKEVSHDNSFKHATSLHFPHRTIQEFLAAFYCFYSNDPTSEWLLPNSKLETHGAEEFERFLLRIALSDKMPLQTEKREYYFAIMTDIDLDITFGAFNTSTGLNNELLNWFLSQCKNVRNIRYKGEQDIARHESNGMSDTSVHNGSDFTSEMSRPTVFSFSDLIKLHTVTFEGCIFEASSQLSFTNCSSLKNLHFHKCEISSSTNFAIATLPAIDIVEFSKCNFDLATWRTITAQIANSSVKCLRLTADFFVKESFPEFLRHLQKCDRIQQIHVKDHLDSNGDIIFSRYEEKVTANLVQTAQSVPKLTNITILDGRLEEWYRERIKKAGQKRNPSFSIKYLKKPIQSKRCQQM